MRSNEETQLKPLKPLQLAACSSSYWWGLDFFLRRDCFARKGAVEHFFGSFQRDAKDERQCCEHDFVQERYSQADVHLGKHRKATYPRRQNIAQDTICFLFSDEH